MAYSATIQPLGYVNLEDACGADTLMTRSPPFFWQRWMGQCVDSENASISSGAQNIMRSINAQLPIMLSANAYKL